MSSSEDDCPFLAFFSELHDINLQLHIKVRFTWHKLTIEL